MENNDRDPHEQYFEGTGPAFRKIFDAALAKDSLVGNTLDAVRESVLNGDFPVDMKFPPTAMDDLLEDDVTPYVISLEEAPKAI